MLGKITLVLEVENFYLLNDILEDIKSDLGVVSDEDTKAIKGMKYIGSYLSECKGIE